MFMRVAEAIAIGPVAVVNCRVSDNNEAIDQL